MGKDITKAMSMSAPYTMALLIIGFGVSGYFIAKYLNFQGLGTALLVLIGVIIGFALSVYDLIVSSKLEEKKLKMDLKEDVKIEALKEILKENEEEKSLENDSD